jgi:hypothetical protein
MCILSILKNICEARNRVWVCKMHNVCQAGSAVLPEYARLCEVPGSVVVCSIPRLRSSLHPILLSFHMKN